MRIEETAIAGVLLVVPERFSDERGFFARTFCADEFRAAGMVAEFVQCNVSFNKLAGTLRGMHYQAAPHGETKLVRCTSGAIWDVVVDLRPGSSTHLQYVAFELTPENRHALYIPAGCAHGFVTLEDNTEAFYQMSHMYAPAHARGLRWNDPALGINWPMSPAVIIERDATYADYTSDADYVE